MTPELATRLDRILNAGTSDGSRKGWETRRGRTETKSGITQLAERSRQHPEGKKASEASYGAMISSRTADEHDENEQYNKENAEEAARAHDQASAAHTAAALAAVRRGDTELAQFHKFRAGSHLTKHLGYLSNGKTPQVTVQNAPKANVGPKLGNTATDPEPFSATMFGNSMNVRKQRVDAARKAGKEEAAETPEQEKEEDKLVNDGEAAAGPAAGASPAVPSRLASLSSSPMLKKEALRNAKEVLRDELLNTAQKHNGYLPNSRHVTQKEIDIAKRHLPVAKPGLLKNGAKKVVRIQNGICRGKKVEFTFNELRDFARNGKVIANWTPPSHIEESGFKP